MKIETWPIDRPIPYARNARKLSDKAVDKVAASLKEYGWRQPVVVDAEGVVIAGHTRLLAAKKLGHTTVPVHVAEGLTPGQVKAYRLMDNRSHDETDWDVDLLAPEMLDLSQLEMDMALTGFNQDEVEKLLGMGGAGQRGGEDSAPDVQSESVSVLGDLWRLGSHRLLCGDATDSLAAGRLMAGSAADCLWTDPPYNVAVEGGTKERLTILNDQMDGDSFDKFLRAAFGVALQALKPGAPAYIAHSETYGHSFRQAFLSAGFKLASCLIWRKNQFVLGRSDYQWRHEPILYGWKTGARHTWLGGRKNTTIAELDEPKPYRVGASEWHIPMGEQVLVIRGENLTVESAYGSVFFEEKPLRSESHPTMKPVALIERMLKNSCASGSTVLDLFGGSGSTLIACEKTNRSARLMELDPRYVDVIVRRWQEFAGQKAILDATGQTFDEIQEARAENLQTA